MKTTIKILSTVICFCSALFAAPALADVWYIVPDGSGDAPTIQAGIDSASAGDIVELACGTYYEHDIAPKFGVLVRSETGLPDCVTIDAQGSNKVINAYHRSGAFEGITMTGATWIGVYCAWGSLDLHECIIIGNSSPTYGGGMVCEGISNSIVTNCSFLDNTAGDKGGGLYCDSTAEIYISYSLFSNNSADVIGGAIFGYSEGIITLDDCIVSENNAGISGGGIYISNSGSSDEPTRLVAQTTTIRDNTALSFVDGYVGYFSEAELTCCDVDMAQWGGEGTIILNNEDCEPIATEEKTWGGIKTLYR